MYLSSDSDYLSRAIIETVSTGNGMRFSTLQKRLQVQFGIKASKATIYRRIADLVDRNIILRHGAELLPNLVWVTSIRQLAERLATKNIGYDSGILELPTKEHQSVVYRASCLAKLDPIWNHVHLELAYRFGQRDWSGYNEHAWYPLGMNQSERQLQEALIEDGQHYRLVYGNDTFLDRLGQKELSTSDFETCVVSSNQIATSLQAFWASKDYIIEVSFSSNILKEFDKFFASVQSEKEFDREGFLEVFRKKSECVLKIEKHCKKAAEYREIITPYFDKDRNLTQVAA